MSVISSPEVQIIERPAVPKNPPPEIVVIDSSSSDDNATTAAVCRPSAPLPRRRKPINRPMPPSSLNLHLPGDFGGFGDVQIQTAEIVAKRKPTDDDIAVSHSYMSGKEIERMGEFIGVDKQTTVSVLSAIIDDLDDNSDETIDIPEPESQESDNIVMPSQNYVCDDDDVSSGSIPCGQKVVSHQALSSGGVPDFDSPPPPSYEEACDDDSSATTDGRSPPPPPPNSLNQHSAGVSNVLVCRRKLKGLNFSSSMPKFIPLLPPPANAIDGYPASVMPICKSPVSDATLPESPTPEQKDIVGKWVATMNEYPDSTYEMLFNDAPSITPTTDDEGKENGSGEEVSDYDGDISESVAESVASAFTPYTPHSPTDPPSPSFSVDLRHYSYDPTFNGNEVYLSSDVYEENDDEEDDAGCDFCC